MTEEEERKERRKLAHNKWKSKNREKFLLQKKRYYANNKERLCFEQAERAKDPVKREKRLASARKRTENLTDGYVRYNIVSCLKQQGITIDSETIPTELIELNRKTILLRRELKERSHGNK